MSFREGVFGIVRGVPKGKVTTYRDVALRMNTGACRAVGQALRANPHRDVPCHRVVRSDGSLGGYRGGRAGEKEALLRKEGVKVVNGRVVLEEHLHRF